MGYIKYKTKNVNNEFKFLDSFPNIKWGEYKNEKFSTNRGLNIFVSTKGNTWQASVEKVPSLRRKDAAGRNIFSVIEAKGEFGDDESKKIFKLISFILLKDNSLSKCGEQLDNIFDEDFVNQAFETDKTKEIADKLNQFFDKLPIVENPQNELLKSHIVKVTEFTDDNILVLLNEIRQITSNATNNMGQMIFAVNDLPYENADLEYIVNQINDIDKIVILTKSDSRFSESIANFKKKATTLPAPITKEFHTKSKVGSPIIPKIVVLLLIISLITNVILLICNSIRISQRNSQIQELEVSKRHLTDGLNRQRDSLEKMNCIQFQLDSLKSLLCYKDLINNNDVRLDLAEFPENGQCKIITSNTKKAYDTIVVRCHMDFDKTKKGYINVYKNAESEPFEEYKFGIKYK